MIYGDSLSLRLYYSIRGKPLCRDIFAHCSATYCWTYPVPKGNIHIAQKLTDDFDFRPNIILESIRNALRNSAMKSAQSVFVLNLGLLYSINLNFTTYQKLIDDVILILLDREVGLGSKAKVVWRTTTSAHTERMPNRTGWRFLTEQVKNDHALL